MFSCNESIVCCYNIVKTLLEQKEKFDALFIWDDRLAIGAIKAIFEAGMRIPKDIAIIGYDDIEISEYFYPPLTTIKQPSYEIGETATRILLDKLESEKKTELEKVILKPELKIRETT